MGHGSMELYKRTDWLPQSTRRYIQLFILYLSMENTEDTEIGRCAPIFN
jgi:hypothetical protein